MFTSAKLALDLGTANSLLIQKGKGIVVREPTVVAFSKKKNKILAVGKAAKEMIGKVPEDVVVTRPLRNGAIASFKMTKALIQHFLREAVGRISFSKPEMIISVPSGLTSVEERAVTEAAHDAGAGQIYLLPEPIAASIGAQMPIGESAGNMIVNMGGGTAEIAVISLNGLVKYESKRISGDALNESITKFAKNKFKMNIGEQMAEKIKMSIGSAMSLKNPPKDLLTGNDVRTGQPVSLEISSNEIVTPIREVLDEIIKSVKIVLEKTPPELSADIVDRGIVLSGGTALTREIDVLYTKSLGVACHVVDNPLTAVVEGLEKALDNIEVFI